MFFGVLMGAFGAHGIKQVVSLPMYETYQTAVFYHIVHALGLMVVGLTQRQNHNSTTEFLLMLGGVFLFSGSLYLYVWTSQRWLAYVTPLGGTVLLVSWLLMAWKTLRSEFS
ncbi:MAG: DUF423 domain-containing protein [Bdellovibrionota bacterium]